MENVNQLSPKPIELRAKIERFIEEALGPVGTNIAGLTEQVAQLTADLEHTTRLYLESKKQLQQLRHERNRLAEERDSLHQQNNLLRGAIEQHNQEPQESAYMSRDEVIELQKQERLDMFAAAALSGSIAADGGQDYSSEAEMAYKYAEAMERKREKRLAQVNPVKT